MGELYQDEAKSLEMAQTLDEDALSELRRMSLAENSAMMVSSATTASIDTQTELDFDLNDGWPPKNWKEIALQHKAELTRALADNEEMHKTLIVVVEENTRYKVMLDEASKFLQICKNLLQQYNDNDVELDLGMDSDDNVSLPHDGNTN